MVRCRKILALGVVSLLATTAGACKKSEKAADKATVAGQAAAGAAPGKTAEKAPVAAAAGDMAYLPADSDVIAQLDLARVRQADLFKEFVEPKMNEEMNKDAEFAEFKTTCGIDPLAEMKTVAFGIKANGNDMQNMVLVVHGIDKAKAIACADKMKEKATAKGGTVTIDGDTVVLTKAGEAETMAFAGVGADVLVLQFGKGVTKDTLKEIVAGQKGASTSATFMELYGKTKEGALRFLVNGNASFMQKAGGMGPKPKALFGTLDGAGGLSLDMRMRLEDAAAAKGLVDMAQSQMAQAKQFFTKADVTADNADVHIDLVMTSEKFKQVIQMVGPMLQGMMGK